MKITAQDLREFDIIDKIIKEPRGGAHKNTQKMINSIKKEIYDELNRLLKKDKKTLLEERYNKFRKMGSLN